MTKRKFFILVSVLTLFAICLLMVFSGYELFIHKLNYGTYSGRLEPQTKMCIEFQDHQAGVISNNSFKGKYVILDFWYTSCGVCYQKFPLVEQAYVKYQDNKNILLYGIHCRLENKMETSTTGVDILISRGYTFPCLSIDIDEPILKEIGVLAFPTVIILDPQGIIVFRGDIKGGVKFMDAVASI